MQHASRILLSLVVLVPLMGCPPAFCHFRDEVCCGHGGEPVPYYCNCGPGEEYCDENEVSAKQSGARLESLPDGVVEQRIACSLEEWSEWPEGLVYAMYPEVHVEAEGSVSAGAAAKITTRVDVPLSDLWGELIYRLEEGATFDIAAAEVVFSVQGATPTTVTHGFANLPIHVDFDPNGDGVVESILLTSGSQTHALDIDEGVTEIALRIESFQVVSYDFPYLGGVSLPESYGITVCALDPDRPWASVTID